MFIQDSIFILDREVLYIWFRRLPFGSIEVWLACQRSFIFVCRIKLCDLYGFIGIRRNYNLTIKVINRVYILLVWVLRLLRWKARVQRILGQEREIPWVSAFSFALCLFKIHFNRFFVLILWLLNIKGQDVRLLMELIKTFFLTLKIFMF